jgi:hypothetical protein
MAYTRQQAIDFWFAFDNYFLWKASEEVRRAYTGIRGPDYLLDRWRDHRAGGTYPAGFVTDAQAISAPLLFIANAQLQLFDAHFDGDHDAEQAAFEDFAQGVLFDDRRARGYKLHMMDSGRAPPIGYHRWYPVARAAMLVDGANAARWLGLARCIGLGWAIQSEARPKVDAPDNPGLPAARLTALREAWLPRSADQLDAAFDHAPYPDSPA